MNWRSTIRFSRNHDTLDVRPARRTLWRSAAVLFLALALGCARKEPAQQTGVGTEAPAGEAGTLGSAAPAFSLPDLDGKTVSLADFKGKVIILDFWATWCPPCRAEVPDFVRLQSKYRDKGLAVVGLSMDAGGVKDVRPFAEEFNVNYTMLIAKDETANAYGGIVGIPTTFVLDRQGRIVKKFVGKTEMKNFEETIQPLLGPAS